MLLEQLKPLHFKFNVDGLSFKAEDFDDCKVTFSVSDAGGMNVGGFDVIFTPEGGIVRYDDAANPGTIERLRRDGIADDVARNVQKTVKSTLA